MFKFVRRQFQEPGQPPGTLVHMGEKRDAAVRITVLDYNEEQFQEREVETAAECRAFKESSTVTWINVDGIHNVKLVGELCDTFEVHPLVQEDIVTTGERPSTEDYGHYLYTRLNMLYYDEEAGELTAEQVSLILGTNFVISFQEKEGDVFEPVRNRIREGKGCVRRMKADYLMYALVDAIVDHYFLVLERLSETVEELETELVDSPQEGILREIHRIKRDLLFIRKSVWPLREVISSYQRAESSLLSQDVTVYLRDVYDHTIQVIDTVETFRDMVSGMMDIYLSSVSNRMNEVMKVLTIMASIFIPLTFIAGIYGMNFEHMPELDWKLGYPGVLLLMWVMAVLMLVYFRRKDWL